MKISHYNNCCTTPPHCYVIRTLLVLGIVTVTVHCAVRAVSLSIVQTDKFCPSLAPLPNVNRILPQCCAQNTTCSPNVQLHSAAHPSALRSFRYLHLPKLYLVLACHYQQENEALSENLRGNKPCAHVTSIIIIIIIFFFFFHALGRLTCSASTPCRRFLGRLHSYVIT